MVSFQAALSPAPADNNSSKKRKSEELFSQPPDHDHDHDKKGSFFDKRSKAGSGTQSIFDVSLQRESTPLPSEWQRCLDIQSGQIHFYNIRTEKRTFDDPRRSPTSPVGGHMSLELQLNLPCDDSPTRTNYSDDQPIKFHDFCVSSEDHKTKDLAVDHAVKRSFPSWLAVEEEEGQEEMMATVCMKCHMLVMLCKSSPACPNCKFMHPVDQGPPKLFKPRQLSLLC